MAHIDNIEVEGCCTLAFVKEFFEEPEGNEQDFNNNNFLPLFLSDIYDKLFV